VQLNGKEVLKLAELSPEWRRALGGLVKKKRIEPEGPLARRLLELAESPPLPLNKAFFSKRVIANLFNGRAKEESGMKGRATVVLDDIDKSLLRILQDNAKTPYSQISKQLGISEATVHLRIKKLVKLGVIKRFQAIVDPEKVGKDVVAIVALTVDPKKYESVLEKLKSMPDVYDIYDVTGEYYTILKVRVGSREELTKVLDEIGGIEGVESTRTMFVLRTIKEESRIRID
jgi:Lrp/AsnC family transcriptional regulator for asnA, asnC and gidA